MKLRHTARRDGRLVTVLRDELGLSSSLVKRLKGEGAFLVSGVLAHTSRPVRAGEEVAVLFREAPPAYPAEDGPLEILYEDEAFLAVDKPPGLWIHPTPGRNSGTLANYVAYYLRGQDCGIHVITRLDRDTFGVALLAKYAHFHACLSGNPPKKVYLATVAGSPPAASGTVEMPIARRVGTSLLREVRPDGKPALTSYSVLTCRNGVSLLELRPQTGRTHQLRVHCAALGCPIVGDRDYGTAASRELSESLGVRTQQLCAYSLSFTHPLTGELVTIHAKQQPFFPKLPVEPGQV